MKSKRKKKYWYMIWYYECPICGRGTTYKERQYSRRPKLWKNRNKFIEDYDYCNLL